MEGFLTEDDTWQNTDEFPQACQNLAQLLYKEAALQSGASVLDVGHASGDSLLLLARDYQPALLHGVTSIPAQAYRARTRLAEQNKSSENLSWQVHCNDAVKFLDRGDEQKYDFIFALDCAYHFQTRKDFLTSCKGRLKPGGKVALIDLVASHPYPDSGSFSTFFTRSPKLPPPPQRKGRLHSMLKHYFVTLLSGVPLINLIPIERYYLDLHDAGFDEFSIKDISHLVFPGFARFLQKLGKEEEAAWRGGGMLQSAALRSFGSVVENWSKGGQEGMVRCVVVVAKVD